ncbi:MAG: WXG100 family type VII secretion target, partial [Marmoricola sp.]
MTLGMGAVLAWRPGELATAADRLRRRIAELSTEVHRVGSAGQATADHWHGLASDAAHRRLQDDLACGDELVASLERVRSRLDGIADSLGYARARVKGLADDADAHRFRVTDDGTVHPPYLPPPALAPMSAGELADYASSYDDLAERLLDEADRRTRELREALREAELADEHQAATLRGLELPAALLDHAFALLPQVPELWSASNDAVSFPAGGEPWPAMARGSDSIWTALVTQGDLRCFPGAVVPEGGDPDGSGTGYYGGGFVSGPDGRRYPLVVPQVVRDGSPYRADGNWQTPPVRDLAGLDPGWHQVGAAAGVAEFGARASTATKILLAAATFSGMQAGPGTGYRRRNDLLGKVRLDGLG